MWYTWYLDDREGTSVSSLKVPAHYSWFSGREGWKLEAADYGILSTSISTNSVTGVNITCMQLLQSKLSLKKLPMQDKSLKPKGHSYNTYQHFSNCRLETVGF